MLQASRISKLSKGVVCPKMNIVDSELVDHLFTENIIEMTWVILTARVFYCIGILER